MNLKNFILDYDSTDSDEIHESMDSYSTISSPRTTNYDEKFIKVLLRLNFGKWRRILFQAIFKERNLYKKLYKNGVNNSIDPIHHSVNARNNKFRDDTSGISKNQGILNNPSSKERSLSPKTVVFSPDIKMAQSKQAKPMRKRKISAKRPFIVPHYSPVKDSNLSNQWKELHKKILDEKEKIDRLLSTSLNIYNLPKKYTHKRVNLMNEDSTSDSDEFTPGSKLHKKHR